jgi:hypothetical protein
MQRETLRCLIKEVKTKRLYHILIPHDYSDSSQSTVLREHSLVNFNNLRNPGDCISSYFRRNKSPIPNSLRRVATPQCLEHWPYIATRLQFVDQSRST